MKYVYSGCCAFRLYVTALFGFLLPLEVLFFIHFRMGETLPDFVLTSGKILNIIWNNCSIKLS